MAHALDKGIMKVKTRVELKVIHDPKTNLAVNVFLWNDANGLHHICEVANPVTQANGGQLGFLVYDEQRDSKNAEARRLELEATL